MADRPYEKRAILDELAWHHDHPMMVYNIMTETEKAEVLRKGHVTKKLWEALKPRIPALEVD